MKNRNGRNGIDWKKVEKKSYGSCHAKRPLKDLAIVISKEAPIRNPYHIVMQTTHMELKELWRMGAEGASQMYHSITDQLDQHDQRAIVLFHVYLPSPYRSPYWICTQHPTCQWSRTSVDVGLMTGMGESLLKTTIFAKPKTLCYGYIWSCFIHQRW